MFCSEKKLKNTIKLIQPIFVNDTHQSYDSVLGEHNQNYCVMDAVQRIRTDISLGQQNFLLFVTTKNKSDQPNWQSHQHIAQQIKTTFGDQIYLIADVCLCGVRTDGHCCVPDDAVLTQKHLGELAQAYLTAGVDCVAPSDMQPFTVATIKSITDRPVMSYSTKFRSALYAPFRLAVDSTPNTERWYQLDVRDRDAAVKSSINYSSQGADFLMVKPGMSSIDLIKPIMDATGKPVGVYQTSGEWVAIQSSTVKDKLLQESMWVFIRAGADFMISYGARLLHKSLK